MNYFYIIEGWENKLQKEQGLKRKDLGFTEIQNYIPKEHSMNN
jgi:hypothetical protein